MTQKRQSDLIKEEIEILLAPLSADNKLHELVKGPLAKVERELTTTGNSICAWPLLPLMVCEAICGRYLQAIPVAAACQFLLAAGDVFDDIEDVDSPESLLAQYGSAVAINAATTLLIIAERAITRLPKRGVEDDITIRIMDAINSYYTTACIGQHLDLSLNPSADITEDTYLEIINMKSASQIECACYVGALSASNNQEIVDIFATFGNNLGIAAQITNDIQGVTLKRDLLNRKITLPVVFALNHTIGETRRQLESFFIDKTDNSSDITKIENLIFLSGGIQYSTIKIEFHRQRALDFLFKAERAGAKIERLKRFLE